MIAFPQMMLSVGSLTVAYSSENRCNVAEKLSRHLAQARDVEILEQVVTIAPILIPQF